MDNPRIIALKAIIRILENNNYADEALSAALSSAKLSSEDKSLVTELVYGVTRYKLTLDYLINKISVKSSEKLSPTLRNILRLALYQIEFTRIPAYAIVNSSVEISKLLGLSRAASFINGVLRGFIRKRKEISFPDETSDTLKYLSVKYSHPEWMIKNWLDEFGLDHTKQLLEYNNTPPIVSISINRLNTTLESVENKLKEAEVNFSRSEISANSLNLVRPKSIKDLPGFAEGEWYVQSEMSSLIVELMPVEKDQLIIDLCAAPGSKTIGIAGKMANTGKIVAVDKSSERLKKLKENCYRMGVTNVEIAQGDATSFALPQGVLADRILIDAPCSNTGVLAKRPDARWKRSPDDICFLSDLQFKILQNTLNLIIPGGLIIYSVCSIEHEEGPSVINKFLNTYSNFTLVDIKNLLPPATKIKTQSGFIRSLPFETQSDGFFIACVKKLF